jgi:bifunctional non-homologous end joining protein LigD
VKASAKPVKRVDAKPGTQWLTPGLIARARHLKGEQTLRRATVQAIGEGSRSVDFSPRSQRLLRG